MYLDGWEIRPTSTVAIGPVTSAESAMFLKLVSYDLFPLISVLVVSNLRMEVTNPGAEGHLRVCGAGAAYAHPPTGTFHISGLVLCWVLL